jgi:hypothetical protein
MNAKRQLVTNSIAPRIKAVLAAAEQTAALVAEEAESEATRRGAEMLADAGADAERIRREATRRVEEYLASSRRRIDAFATARIERITELTEGVIEASASIQERFEQAASIQREVHAMVEALGAVAQAVAKEAALTSPTLPRAPAGSNAEAGPSWARTGPDGSVIGEAPVNGSAPSPSLDGLGDAGVTPVDSRARVAASDEKHFDLEEEDVDSDEEDELSEADFELDEFEGAEPPESDDGEMTPA